MYLCTSWHGSLPSSQSSLYSSWSRLHDGLLRHASEITCLVLSAHEHFESDLKLPDVALAVARRSAKVCEQDLLDHPARCPCRRCRSEAKG